MKPPRSITVDMSDRNGSRWTTANWLNTDLARITEVQGKLRLNHLKGEGNAHKAFFAWLGSNVKPETFDWIMSNEGAFAISYSAYKHLAAYQARMKEPINREALPAESIPNV